MAASPDRVPIAGVEDNDVGDLVGGTDGRRWPSSRRYSEKWNRRESMFAVASHPVCDVHAYGLTCEAARRSRLPSRSGEAVMNGGFS